MNLEVVTLSLRMNQKDRSRFGKAKVLLWLTLMGLFSSVESARAFMAFPGGGYPVNQWPMPPMYFPPYQTNLNFYGNPWGQVPPVYFYPSLTPFPGMPPSNFFMPHYPSPYGPGNFCPTCNPMIPQPFIPQPNQPHSPFVS